MVGAVRRALREEAGDVLVFLPGIGEISRVADAARRRVGPDVDVHRSPARWRSRSRTGPSRRHRPAGAASCCRPTSPRRR